jgi:hypothetical protein
MQAVSIPDMNEEELKILKEQELADRKRSKWVSLQPQEELDIQFDIHKITDSERTFRGNTSPVKRYVVKIPNWSETQEYELQLSLTWARNLRKKMIETGKTFFRVRREGSSATDTKYTFDPIEKHQ